MLHLLLYAAAATPAVPIEPEKWFTVEDYPVEALAKWAEGTVVARIQIGADGLPSSCSIEKSSGDKALDSVTCEKITQRARFTPATDNRGKPIQSAAEKTIAWRIPGFAGRAVVLESNALHVALVDGRPDICTEIRSTPSKSTSRPPTTCRPAVSDAVRFALGERATNYASIDTRLYISTLDAAGVAAVPEADPYNLHILLSESLLELGSDGNVASCQRLRVDPAFDRVDQCRELSRAIHLGAVPASAKSWRIHAVQDIIARAKPSYLPPGIADKSSKPKPINEADWFTQDDYPAEAWDSGAEGNAKVLVRIDKAGKLVDCEIEASTGDARLDDQSCNLLRKRARFQPATDILGQPVKGVYRRTVSWQIPGYRLSSTGMAALTLDGNGRVLRCKNVRPESERDEPADMCDWFGADDFLNRIAGSKLGKARSAHVKLMIEPAADVGRNISRSPERWISLYEAQFDIRRDGHVASCTPTYADEGLSDLALCQDLISISKFEADPNAPELRRERLELTILTAR